MTTVGIFSSITIPSTSFFSRAAFSAQKNQPFNMLHGNLQMSKIFQSYAAITDLLKNHTYYRHITNGHRIYYRLFQYSCNLYDFLFFTPKNWQQSFSVPLKSHPQHFQVMLITFFFSSQESAFCTPLHFNIFQLFSTTTLSANTWQIYQINFNL